MSDFSFVPTTTKYHPKNALSLGKAAGVAYEDEQKIRQEVISWGFGKFKFFDHAGTQAFLAGREDMIIVAFRGTEPAKLKDWLTDTDFDLVEGKCCVERGLRPPRMTARSCSWASCRHSRRRTSGSTT